MALGLEVSVTFESVPTEERELTVAGTGAWVAETGKIPILLETPVRLLSDKVAAFVGRKEKDDEKRARDALDIVTLVKGWSLQDVADAVYGELQKEASRHRKTLPQTFAQQCNAFGKRLSRLGADSTASEENRMTALPWVTRDSAETLRTFAKHLSKPRGRSGFTAGESSG